MQHRVLGYAAIVVASVLVGILVGGGPGALIDSAPGPARPPATTTGSAGASTTAVPATTTSAPVTVPPTTAPTEPVPTEPVPTEPSAPGTDPSGTTPVPTVASTTLPPSDPVPRDLPIVVANGAGLQGVATLRAGLIEDEGFTDVTPLNAIELTDTTGVYHPAGLEGAARQVATAAGFPDAPVLPWFDRPALEVEITYDVLLLLGSDLRAEP